MNGTFVIFLSHSIFLSCIDKWICAKVFRFFEAENVITFPLPLFLSLCYTAYILNDKARLTFEIQKKTLFYLSSSSDTNLKVTDTIVLRNVFELKFDYEIKPASNFIKNFFVLPFGWNLGNRILSLDSSEYHLTLTVKIKIWYFITN